MTAPIKSPRKLIEVALPLDDINVAAAREKSIRHGHPSTLHLWWARRPLAAARAVLFAQLVNDPGYETGQGFTRGVNKKQAAIERERLFKIIRELVKWENTNNETVLEAARDGDPQELGRNLPPQRQAPAGRRTVRSGQSCPPSTTPSPAAVPSRWRPSAWAWKPMPRTSTRWRC